MGWSGHPVHAPTLSQRSPSRDRSHEHHRSHRTIPGRHGAVAEIRRRHDARAVGGAATPGKWSTLEVICHIADFEPVYADRMKRVIAEDYPLLLAGDPDIFQARLAYSNRDAEEEL